MNRRLSMALAAYGAWSQAIVLLLFDPMKQWVTGALAPGADIQDVRVLGLSLDGFAVRDLHHVQGWLPQLVFVLSSGVLTYGVFRGAGRLKPQLRTVVALTAASLLAAGVAMLIGPALDPQARSALPTYDEWFMEARLGAVAAAAAQFALCTSWLTVAVWLLVWRYRQWQPLQQYLGTSGDTEAEVPLLVAARERRDLVCAGLIPMVVLAVAGGPVLRHIRVRQLEQTASGTFDPELWTSYRPPALVDEWSGILYPALRLRPVSTERISGWLATLAICAVFLVVLAVVLRSMAGHAPQVLLLRRPVALMRVVMKGWYATLLAAVAAAVVDGWLLQWFAPRWAATATSQHLAVALGDAVRFATAWGWATGLAFLGAVLLMRRRGADVAPGADVSEERLSDAQ
ncbi:hypothetical protein [Streptomyces sp. NPDC055749]